MRVYENKDTKGQKNDSHPEGNPLDSRNWGSLKSGGRPAFCFGKFRF